MMSLLSLLALSPAWSSLAPQDPPPALLATARAELGRLLADQRHAWLDQPDPQGAVWARGGNYKASFDANGWTFIAQPRPGADRLEPIHFGLAQVRLGAATLHLEQPAPVRAGQRLTYDHGATVQTIDADGTGVEQRFVFTTLPERGELSVELAVTTDLAAAQEPAGLRFSSPRTEVTYSRAIAIDARGARLDLETTFAAGQLTIRVPAAFVATAALPLTIDPRVASAVPATSNSDLADPDVCATIVPIFTFPTVSSTTIWSVVYANYFGASDWDCFVQNYTVGLIPIGSPFVIDTTTLGWARPRIASLRATSKVMVVAQVHQGSSQRWIGARGISMGSWPTITVGPRFDVSFEPFDCLRPDIGGSAMQFVLLPSYFTVVWERATTSTDHDIQIRQIDWNSGLRPGPITLGTNGLDQRNPAVSKSCGPWDGAFGGTQTSRFCVVFDQLADPGNRDIHGAFLSWDGVPIPVGLGLEFALDTSPHDDAFPTVSSPTALFAGSRRFLAAYERSTSGNGDIAAVCFDHLGTIAARANITQLEGSPTRLTWPQRRPSVDSDGIRFGVAYHELFQNNPTVNDLDTRMSLVALGSNGLVVQEPAAILGFTINREFNVQTASLYAATGVHDQRYVTANDRDNTGNTFAIDVRTYDGVPVDTFVTRPIGCGTATLVATGHPRIGFSVSFTASLGGAPTGVLLGTPTTLPVASCPACTVGVSTSSVYTTTAVMSFPLQPSLIGLQMSAQGIAAGPGSVCTSSLHLTHAIDFTVQ